MRRTRIGRTPLRPYRAFGSGDLDGLMMPKSRKRLDNHRVSTVGKADRRGEMVMQIGLTKNARGRAGIDRNRFATWGHVPTCEIKKVNRFFENPASNALAIVAPA